MLSIPNMKVPTSHFAIMEWQSRDYFMAFLQTELELGLNLVGVARFARLVGHHRYSGRSVQYAKKVYSEIATYVANPKYSKHLTIKQRQGIEARMDNLRKALDAVSQDRNGKIRHRLVARAVPA